jgi:hypothetical protein
MGPTYIVLTYQASNFMARFSQSLHGSLSSITLICQAIPCKAWYQICHSISISRAKIANAPSKIPTLPDPELQRLIALYHLEQWIFAKCWGRFTVGTLTAETFSHWITLDLALVISPHLG